MNAAVREHFLHRLHELVHKRVQLSGGNPRLAKSKVQRVVEQGLIVGPEIKVNWQQVLRGDAGAGRVKLKFANRDCHAVCSQIAQTKNPAAGCDADCPHVLLRPVAQHFPHAPLMFQ